jgi:hypothetical protein
MEDMQVTDKMRWRYGDTNPVVAAVDSETVIEIGDMLWLDTDDAKPAAQQADQGTVAANQEKLADQFLGVAMQRSRAGDTDPIRVATTGVFEFEAYGAFELGDLVGPAASGSGTLQSQAVAAVDSPKCAIGRVGRRETVNCGSVLVDIRSTVMTGGVVGTTSQQ